MTKLSALILIFALVSLLLLWTRLYSYLLFHTLVDLFSVVVAASTFFIVWNVRFLIAASYLVSLGCTFLCVGALLVLHILAYKGMNIFRGYDANLPTQLWIATRYLLGLSFALAPWFIKRRVNPWLLLGGNAAAALLLGLAIFLGFFPDCFIEGQGLTRFKVVSEAVTAILFGASIYLLQRRKGQLDRRVRNLISASLAVEMASSASFSLYQDVYGLSNMLGHVFQLLAHVLVYAAIIETGLRRPLSLLFKELRDREIAQVNLIDDLTAALGEVKQLSGLLPICASCKKIRDDQGYWRQIESYIQERSEAQFTHGICPECARRLYPEIRARI